VSTYTVYPDGTVARINVDRGHVDVEAVPTIRLKCDRCGWSPIARRDSGLPHPGLCSCGGYLRPHVDKQ
jgi:hypothetical protein